MRWNVLLIPMSFFMAFQAMARADMWVGDGIDSDLGPMVRVVIFENSYGSKNVGLTFPSSECRAYEQDVQQAPSYQINGMEVQTYAQCIGAGVRLDFPATPAGMRYVIEQFHSQQQVAYSQDGVTVTFNTYGFRHAYLNYGMSMQVI